MHHIMCMLLLIATGIGAVADKHKLVLNFIVIEQKDQSVAESKPKDASYLFIFFLIWRGDEQAVLIRGKQETVGLFDSVLPSPCAWGFHMQLLAQRWTAQIPFQSSACQTLSTWLSSRTSSPNPTERVHTSVCAAQEIKELHSGRQKTSYRAYTHYRFVPSFLFCLPTSLLYSILTMFKVGGNAAHWWFSPDTPGGGSQ